MAARPDAAAQAALGADVRRPFNLCWLDIAGAPIWVTDAPYSQTFTGTGDEDLDGKTFQALDPRFVSVGEVKQKEGGSDTVLLELSGLAGLDDEVMTELGNKASYQGRVARLWKGMLHPTELTRLGIVWSTHTGYMSVPRIVGDKTSQKIQLEIETYLAFLSQASGRTYLDQILYDPGDRSADMAIAMANGAGKPR